MRKTQNAEVSVGFITYNQEKFVEQALMSAVNQKVNFPYEIVIGEDCSTDRTPLIIRKIADEYPDIIRILPREKNLGAFENALDVEKNCTGKYRASLEGDDYWTDEYKLQKQFDFLEKHHEFVMCFTDALEIDESGKKEDSILRPPEVKSFYNFIDILNRNFIPTCTVLYRTGLVKEYPEWYTDLNQCDWSHFLLISQFGNIGYIPEVSAVRRLHDQGLWAGLSRENRIIGGINSLETIDKHFNYKYHSILSKRVWEHEFKLAVEHELNNNLRKSLSLLIFKLHKFVFNEYVSNKELAKLIVKLILPRNIKAPFRRRSV